MSLHDSEVLALAAAAHSGFTRLSSSIVPAADYAFAARVLRLRPASRLLILAQGGIAALPAEPVAPAQVIAVSLLEPAGSAELAAIRAGIEQLPLRSSSIDAIAEFAPSAALAVEADEEAVSVLLELARVLRPGGRYICGGAPALISGPPRASTDKRRLDEWRREARDVLHHSLRLVRPDGSWRRLHERLRLRSLAQIEGLLDRAGLELLNAFDGYEQKQVTESGARAVLLCAKPGSLRLRRAAQ